MKRNSEHHLREQLNKEHECYVLITCNKPSDNGEMQVEMTYEGDVLLASYLLQGAQTLMDEKVDQEPLF